MNGKQAVHSRQVCREGSSKDREKGAGRWMYRDEKTEPPRSGGFNSPVASKPLHRFVERARIDTEKKSVRPRERPWRNGEIESKRILLLPLRKHRRVPSSPFVALSIGKLCTTRDSYSALPVQPDVSLTSAVLHSRAIEEGTLFFSIDLSFETM